MSIYIGKVVRHFALRCSRVLHCEEDQRATTALLKLPLDTLDRRASLGSPNEDGLRVLHDRVARAHERVARAHELKPDVMIVERARRLLEAAQRRPARSTRQTSDS